ncbi:alpha/beta hydrolase [Chitinophaga pinensis]|uniref:Lysophospholipase-like protein n=1 Tax=Chitinophaga pinensis (strain ATCC 43595 / DSM 2588 / LMG 13176 / NBRC 15968 / NCIMB 11800 / UQM 2034) TaxID=485918 RepID=A0A979GNH4_CHIPD|nr:alpha/beta fold hydrolase [Chitinophaga pinensis]ACU58413.1 Lysophospholipase-like protein [Chitinophaga pinensis DSM 2588]
MKFLKRTLRVVLVLFLLLNVVAAFHAWKFTHFYAAGTFANKHQQPEQMSVFEKAKMVLLGVRLSKSAIRHTPEVPYETMHLQTSNGLELEGWWMPRPDAKGTVILFHGYNGGKDGPIPEAAYFRQLGYNTLLMDFRAHGNSQGDVCTIGYKEAEDVMLAYNFVQQKGEKHIILWGVSMGAAAILRAVPTYHLYPDKVILECSFARLTDAVKGRMRAVSLPPTPLAEILTFWGGVENGFWGFSHNPAEYAKSINMPALVCWGTKDNRVTRQETNSVYRQLGTRKKKLIIFEASGHQSFCRNEGEKWKTAVKSFLQ